jgi:bacillithiol biosynthesis cysteine-adding enzyme BshC
MEAGCLRHTELPNTSRLFSDFLYQFERVAPFYEDGRDPTQFPAERRAALVAALAEQNGASASLELLAKPGTAAVVTGQQVGLFSGPAYTVYKALTAICLAKQMTEQGTPAVPVFWLATEDHDFAEVNHAWVFDTQARPVRVEIAASGAEGQPVGSIRIDSWGVEQLCSVLEGHAYGAEVCELVRTTYLPGRTMGEAFQALLQRLFSQYGLLFVDPLSPALRRIAVPLLREAVGAAPELRRLVLERNAALTAAGYHTQVHVEPDTSLFFLLEDGRRVSLKNGRYSTAQLAERAEELSPNALLRPVVQDYLLPTAAYVGGPAELAYFAQSQVLYSALLGAMPRLVSRAGFTLLDRRSAKLMDRYQLRLHDFFHGEEALREKAAAALVPPKLRGEFAEARAQAEALLSRLEADVDAFDPTLAAAAAKSRAKIIHQLTKLEGKVARESMRREARASDDATWLYNTIFPHRHLQERFYSILPFLARHGMGLLETLRANVHLNCPDHVVLRLET